MARKKREDGRYQVQVELPLKAGDTTRRRKYFYGATLTEARAKRDAFLAEQERKNKTDVDTDVLLSDWAQTWLNSIGGTLTFSERRNASYAISALLRGMPDIRVRDLKPHHIQTYMSSLAGMSRATISKQRQTLRNVLDFAVTNGIIDRSPWQGIRSPKGTYKGHRVITPQEREAILNGWRNCRGALWALVMLYTGMRKGELFALAPSDIDFDAKMIRISKAAVLSESGRIKEPKTEAGVRSVPLLPALEEPLRIACASGTTPLFLTVYGKPMYTSAFERDWRAMRKALNINIQAHDLRYSYASMLYDAGVGVLAAAKLLGHRDVKITMGIYTKLSATKEQSEIEKLRAWLSNGCQT